MKKILFSLIAILLAVGVVGAGAFALFSDVETVGVHDIQAGTLDLTVGGGNPCDQHITIKDIKPGFYQSHRFLLKNVGTLDGHLWVEFSDITNKENDRTEPEIAAGDPEDTSGELGEFLLLSLWRFGDGFIAKNKLNVFGGTSWDKLYYNESAHAFQDMILAEGDTYDLQLIFHLPKETGNIIQSDSVEFDIIFHLDQA